MHGLHLIADLYDCNCPQDFLLDEANLKSFCISACAKHGLTVVGQCFHQFRSESGQPAGVTGTVVLAESHLAVHTWPEIAAVTLDVYVCNYSADNSERALALFTETIAAFAPGSVKRKIVTRGRLGGKKPSTGNQTAMARGRAIRSTVDE